MQAGASCFWSVAGVIQPYGRLWRNCALGRSGCDTYTYYARVGRDIERKYQRRINGVLSQALPARYRHLRLDGWFIRKYKEYLGYLSYAFCRACFSRGL